MCQPSPGTAWMPADVELGWPGVVGRLTGLQAAPSAAPPDALTVLEWVHQDEWIGGCASPGAIAAGFSLPGRAR